MRANIPKGMGGGPQSRQAIARQAQKMQEDMAEKQAELDARTYEVQAGGGAVTVTINGKKEVLSVNIKPEAVDPEDVEMLQDLVVSAVNEALRQAGEAMDKSMEGVTGGLDLSGFGL